MSTSQLQLESGTWTDTFAEIQDTQLQSTVFVRKLLAIAVSNIAYTRVMFPEDAFTDRLLDGLNLKILKNDKSCPFAEQLILWLHGVFDAVEKKYLRMLVVGIYKNPSDLNTLLEMYTFRFAYNDATELEIYSGDRKITSASTANQTRKATISLLHNLMLLTGMLKPLPQDVGFTMKLCYYEDVTPEDYEPPGFQAAESDLICMEGNLTKFRFHSVSTAFHSLQLSVIAPDVTTANEDEAALMQGNQQMTDEVPRAMDVEMGATQIKQVRVVDNTTLETSAVANHCSQLSTPAHDGNLQAGESCNNIVPVGIRCPCRADEDDGLMILCSVCHYWQHAICFKIFHQSNAPARHVCNLCCNSARAEPTDRELADVNEREAQTICLWRRSLVACLEVKLISSAGLANRLGVSDSVASRLTDRLVSEGYATSKRKAASSTKIVQQQKIKREALVKYFS